MPAWLSETGATPVTDAKMELAQGSEVVFLATATGWFTVRVVGWGARAALNKLAEKYGWDIRFAWLAAHTCQ